MGTINQTTAQLNAELTGIAASAYADLAALYVDYNASTLLPGIYQVGTVQVNYAGGTNLTGSGRFATYAAMAAADAANTLPIGFYTAVDTGEIVWFDGTDVGGFKQAGSGAVARTLQSKSRDSVSVKDFGAVGDGVTDDTVAIDAALNHTSTNRIKLIFPAGTYIYNGTGAACSGPIIIVEGSGQQSTTITLGASSRLIDTSTLKEFIDIRGFTFSGGLGAFRSTYASGDVNFPNQFIDNVFYQYTKCAIDLNYSDGPYANIEGNTFWAANSTSTIGIALNRWADASVISKNNFLTNAIHLKCRSAGRRVNIFSNNFLQFEVGSGALRANIWFVTNSTPTVSAEGTGCLVTHNTFGNENLVATDYRILYAPEGATGTYNGDIYPDVSASTIETISGADISRNSIIGNDLAVVLGFVYTTTPYIWGASISNNCIRATPPKYLLHYKAAPTVADSYSSTNKFLDNSTIDVGAGYAPFKQSNCSDNGPLVDFSYFLAGESTYIHAHTSGANDLVDYINLYSSRGATLSLISGSNLGIIADATGDITAANNLSLNASGAVVCNLTTASILVGFPAWIEFDCQASGGTPATTITIQIVTGSGNYFQRIINAPSTWKRFRFPYQFKRNDTLHSLVILNQSAGTVTLSVGRIRVYHAREPVSWGRSTFEQLNLAALPTSSAGLPSGSLWVDAAAGDVIKRVP